MAVAIDVGIWNVGTTWKGVAAGIAIILHFVVDVENAGVISPVCGVDRAVGGPVELVAPRGWPPVLSCRASAHAEHKEAKDHNATHLRKAEKTLGRRNATAHESLLLTEDKEHHNPRIAFATAHNFDFLLQIEGLPGSGSFQPKALSWRL
jgi:hypothetical protein